MKPRTLFGLAACAAFALGATCDTLTPKDYERFSSVSGLLVGEGDPNRGRAAFLALECQQCHTVSGLTLEPVPSPLGEVVPLGGTVEALPSDGYLATAIIHPDHDLAEGLPREIVSEDGTSRMADYSDLITIRQLRDLVAFLHRHYRAAP
jgi:hypothetical protein